MIAFSSSIFFCLFMTLRLRWIACIQFFFSLFAVSVAFSAANNLSGDGQALLIAFKSDLQYYYFLDQYLSQFIRTLVSPLHPAYLYENYLLALGSLSTVISAFSLFMISEIYIKPLRIKVAQKKLIPIIALTPYLYYNCLFRDEFVWPLQYHLVYQSFAFALFLLFIVVTLNQGFCKTNLQMHCFRIALVTLILLSYIAHTLSTFLVVASLAIAKLSSFATGIKGFLVCIFLAAALAIALYSIGGVVFMNNWIFYDQSSLAIERLIVYMIFSLAGALAFSATRAFRVLAQLHGRQSVYSLVAMLVVSAIISMPAIANGSNQAAARLSLFSLYYGLPLGFIFFAVSLLFVIKISDEA